MKLGKLPLALGILFIGAGALQLSAATSSKP